MLARFLRRAAWSLYAGLVAVVFVAASYLAFNLFVRSGVTPVPEVRGLALATAQAKLRERALVMDREAGERYDDEVPAGHVLRQSPAAGSLVKRGGRVEVAVSLGPQVVAVPDLRGAALPAAQVTLAAAGLTVGRAIGVYSPDSQPGTVVDQAPAPGDRAGSAAAVDLFLSSGDPATVFVMPDLVYRDYEQVRRFFERRGFRLGSVKFESYEGIQSGVVLRQFPLAGHPLSRREVISLVVASDDDVGTS
jgi:serine/threonine-protein kinase